MIFGAQNLSQKFGLPNKSLDFLLNFPVNKINPQIFYQQIGKARLEEIFGQATPQQIAHKFSPSIVDNRLGIYQGTTQQLLNGQLTKEQFAEKIGKSILKYSTIFRVAQQQFHINSYFFTPEDLYQILSGNTKNVFNKIAGLQLEKSLHLMPGRGIKFFNNYDAKNKKELLSEISADWIAHWLGMAPLDFNKKPSYSLAAAQLEQTLGLNVGSVANSKNLSEIIQRNGTLNFALAFRIPLPFSSHYTNQQFQNDLQLANLKNSNNQKNANKLKKLSSD